MLAFIDEYAQEWKSGKLSSKTRARDAAPWSKHKSKESAYDQSLTKYSAYKDTISFLVESYLKDKKKFIKYHQQEGLPSPLSPRRSTLTDLASVVPNLTPGPSETRTATVEVRGPGAPRSDRNSKDMNNEGKTLGSFGKAAAPSIDQESTSNQPAETKRLTLSLKDNRLQSE